MSGKKLRTRVAKSLFAAVCVFSILSCSSVATEKKSAESPAETGFTPVSDLQVTAIGETLILGWKNPEAKALKGAILSWKGPKEGSVQILPGTDYVLSGFENGEYTIGVQVIDTDGAKSLTSTQKVTVLSSGDPVWFTDTFQSETGGTLASAKNWEFTSSDTSSNWSIMEEKNNKVLQYNAGSSTGYLIAVMKDSSWAEVEKEAKAEKGTLGDYYFEAKIRPMANSTTGVKHLWMIARYKDTYNWYFGGLNVQNSNTATQVELGYNTGTAFSVNRKSQVKKPITIAQWYTVRFQLEGNVLSSFLDGSLIGSYTVTEADMKPLLTSGKVGLYTANKAFQIDDIKIGPVSIPASISVTPEMKTWKALANDKPLNLEVTAKTGKGVEETFTIVSSNPAVAKIETKGSSVSISPIAQGEATIWFVSASGKTESVTISIGKAFATGSASYQLEGKTSPSVSSQNAFIDSDLALTFDAPPVLLPNGIIRIYRATDDVLVDEIVTGKELTWLGNNSSANIRGVNTTLIRVEGNTLIITPHNGVLDYGTKYYIEISDATVTGSIAGVPFSGLSKNASWSFTTKKAPLASLSKISVSPSSASADFRSVQGAFNFVMKNKIQGAQITIANGTYTEPLFLRDVQGLTIVGENREKTIIQHNNHDSLNPGTGASGTAIAATGNGGRSIFLVENCDLLTLSNITLQSTHSKANELSNQAEVLYFNSPAGRLIVKNSTLVSYQDTIQTKGFCWFYDSLIAGDVDFIWGSASVNLFENCEIRTRVDSRPGNARSGGYLVQARGIPKTAGYVFLNCSLTREEGVPDNVTGLARTGGSSYYDNVAFINCKMDAHIKEVGFHNSPLPTPATLERGWKEYGSMTLDGKTKIDLSKRLATYALILTDAQAKGFYSDRSKIFGGGTVEGTTLTGFTGGWNPQP